MSRSFGDYIASTVGVVSDPEVTYFKVDFEVGFLVIASDGVWEFLTNQNVCEIL
jgi:serine/threonine protein phosphatase PrpC